jgi:hypothetical protein
MDSTYWFSHDYNARFDGKIKKMLSRHGLLGYGVFWAIIEDLYNNANALQTDYDSIAYDLRVDKNVVESVVKDFELFEIKGKIFRSHSVQKRIDIRNEKSLTASNSANKRWEKYHSNAIALQTQSEGNAKKGKEIKEKEILREVFNSFRLLYKGTKGGLDVEFNNFTKKNKDWSESVHLLRPALEKQILWREHQLKNPENFVPSWKNLETWINKKCWLQETPSVNEVVKNERPPKPYPECVWSEKMNCWEVPHPKLA